MKNLEPRNWGIYRRSDGMWLVAVWGGGGRVNGVGDRPPSAEWRRMGDKPVSRYTHDEAEEWLHRLLYQRTVKPEPRLRIEFVPSMSILTYCVDCKRAFDLADMYAAEPDAYQYACKSCHRKFEMATAHPDLKKSYGLPDEDPAYERKKRADAEREERIARYKSKES